MSSTIFQNMGIYVDYPFGAIEPDAYQALNAACKELPPNCARAATRVIKALECYLQISNQRISRSSLKTTKIQKTYRCFIGALYSPRFIEAPNSRRYVYCDAFLKLLKTLKQHHPEITVPDFRLTYSGLSSDAAVCKVEFQKLPLDFDKVRIWQGWPTTNRRGATHWLPLFHIHQRLGTEFAEELYRACDTYFRTRRSARVPCIKTLDKFIANYDAPITPIHLKQSSFATTFWRDFFEFYLIEGHAEGKGATPNTLITTWRNEFLSFAEDYLFKPGVVAKPNSALPSPKARNVRGASTNISCNSDGIEVKTKLLTPVPLQVTDSQAMDLLFRAIRNDVNHIVSWAEAQVRDMWSRYETRCQDAINGTPRHMQPAGTYSGGHKWLTNPANPKCLQNAAATFAYYGYCTSNDQTIGRIYPSPLSATAHYLALPTRLSLLPHCTLLVAQHPEITEAFLTNLELYNKNGNLTGFIEGDSGSKLIGYKDRKGARLAQQVINLTPRTAEVVRQMIVLTQPLRDYLRNHGDGNWRRLLLSAQRGFGYPKRVGEISPPLNEAVPMKSLISSLAAANGLSNDAATDLMKRFSLTSLRASVAVLIYIETQSLEKMAKALGHTSYSPRLLSHYLPEPLLAFFQERWIRIFQTGIIVDSMKDSECLLEASGFTTLKELDEFLSNHALKNIPELKAPPLTSYASPSTTTSQQEVVFGVNTPILTAMLSLQHAVLSAKRAVCEKALYWSEMTRRLVNHIDSERNNRPDLYEQLLEAKKRMTPNSMEGLIYA